MQETDVPQVALPFIVFSMCMLGLLVLSARYWIQCLMLWTSGRPIFPRLESRRIQRWGLVDLLFAFVVIVGLQFAAAYSGMFLRLGSRSGPDGEMGLVLLTWVSAIQTLAVGITTVFIARRCNVAASSVGWSTKRMSYDLRLGVKAFIVLAPPIYMLMIVVTLLSGQEYKHPIHTMASDDPWMLLPAIVMAVILAPIGEEFAFRVLLQGFFESLSVGRFSVDKFFLGRIFEPKVHLSPPTDTDPRDSDLIVTPRLVTEELSNPYASTAPFETEDTGTIEPNYNDSLSEGLFLSSENEVITTPLPWWPVIVSGVLFGLAHFEYGMSWIPLSVLGIALGWLYRLTNRIWPSLVVHFCINATSMVGFSLTVLYGDPTEAIAK